MESTYKDLDGIKAPAKMASKSKKDSKDQESIQSSTTSVPGYLMGK